MQRDLSAVSQQLSTSHCEGTRFPMEKTTEIWEETQQWPWQRVGSSGIWGWGFPG